MIHESERNAGENFLLSTDFLVYCLNWPMMTMATMATTTTMTTKRKEFDECSKRRVLFVGAKRLAPINVSMDFHEAKLVLHWFNHKRTDVMSTVLETKTNCQDRQIVPDWNKNQKKTQQERLRQSRQRHEKEKEDDDDLISSLSSQVDTRPTRRHCRCGQRYNY